MSLLRSLALWGGEAAVPEGAPDWPLRDEEVRAALEMAWETGDWGRYHGEQATRLCRQLAERHRTEHVTLCSSGTIAVELALRGLGVEPNDEVILAGYDFPGNFRAIEAIGAHPVLVDVIENGTVLDAERISEAISSKVRAIVVSHMHGTLANMPRIASLGKNLGIRVLEDVCQTPGARVAGRPAGLWGDAAVLSFGGSKLVTAGRGGAILTQHATVHQRMKVFSERGNQAFPLSELQAAVLLPQWRELDARNARRAVSVARILASLPAAGCFLPVAPSPVEGWPSYYKVGLRYQEDRSLGWPRTIVERVLQSEGVAAAAGFRGFGKRSSRRCRIVGDLEHSAQAAEELLLLHHPVLLAADETIDHVIAALRKVNAVLQSCEFSPELADASTVSE